MFHFIRSLFSPSADRVPGLDNELIEAATDRVIMGTDKEKMGTDIIYTDSFSQKINPLPFYAILLCNTEDSG